MTISPSPSPVKKGRSRKVITDSEESDDSNKGYKLRRNNTGRSYKKHSNVSMVTNSYKRKLSLLEEVKKSLHTSHIPENLLKRENEYGQVKSFFDSCIEEDSESQALYISGAPGTGKTATVLKVKADFEASGTGDFTFAHVNGLEVTDPKSIFVSIYQQVMGSGKKVSANNARQKLNEMFSFADRERIPILILVDELDMLLTKRQEVVYDIFNWTAIPEARINVIAISNTLDLPERKLNHRISSRLGSFRICFQPYDHTEIVEIISQRIGKSKAISSDAVQLASRKVAALSGDLRKALDIMRRGVEIAIDSKAAEMTMDHVQTAIKEAKSDIGMDFFRSISKHQVALMSAVVQDQLKSGLEESTFLQIFEEYRPICTQYGLIPLPMSLAWCGVIFLNKCHLLVLGLGSGDVSRKIRLGMSSQEASACLNMLKSADQVDY